MCWEAPVDFDPKEFEQRQFEAAQRPIAWLLSAERLRSAADAILKHELPTEIPYFQARAVAEHEAITDAYRDGKEAGSATIRAIAPNYPPAQLLYAYAIENVMKGLIVSKSPNLIQEARLARDLTTHNIIKLAEMAAFAVHVQEVPVLRALSELSVWAGRYPVALSRADYAGAANADELLDYGSAHPIMKTFFKRAYAELAGRLPEPLTEPFGVLVVFRQPGT
jgi:hypothetical protein